ncbi:hypothetical protein [Streptomyces sp. WMMC897]|uniref:hypothetical protein n=1 Tax=Streptomyces sp. WMMC897 TaxID=3014782 RepID=UPI0022B730EF|nr:hypothetical protein [Streptomyces sp. WMMC897]MCZ7414310.1 hypothetical protein [Streptomyces sp. WMMC897]
MRVKFLQLQAGPKGCVQPGTVVDLPRAEAEARIRAGVAAPVDEAPAVRRPAFQAPEGDGDRGAVDKPLAARTNEQIRAYAGEHGIELAGATTKADMLSAIERHEQAADDQDDGGD